MVLLMPDIHVHSFSAISNPFWLLSPPASPLPFNFASYFPEKVEAIRV